MGETTVKMSLLVLFLALIPQFSFAQQSIDDQEALITIYIDKAPSGSSRTAQNMHIYHKYEELPLLFSIVSTGRENEEELSKSGKTTDSITPVGRFKIHYMNIDHVSKLWGGAPMPYAIFFHGGVAIHGVFQNAYGDLGGRASGGCVRLPMYMAKQTWDLVMKYGSENVEIVVYDSSDWRQPLPRAYFH